MSQGMRSAAVCVVGAEVHHKPQPQAPPCGSLAMPHDKGLGQDRHGSNNWFGLKSDSNRTQTSKQYVQQKASIPPYRIGEVKLPAAKWHVG